MSTAHRIDVHQHAVPPLWAKALPAHGGDPSGPRSGDPSNTVLPPWSPDSAIDFMDSQQIAATILSLTAPGITGWDKGRRRERHTAHQRTTNEWSACQRLPPGQLSATSANNLPIFRRPE
jgi:6-methylsalicylate decarboxylase